MDLLANTKLSDFQIQVDDHIYKVHKLVLYRCEYFVSLFSAELNEVSTGKVVLPYKKQNFDKFIEILYTLRRVYSKDLTPELFEIAMCLQFDYLINEFTYHMNDVESPVLNDMLPLLLTSYSNHLSRIRDDIFAFKCNEYTDLVIDLLPQIDEEQLVLKIIHLLRDMKLSVIVETIESWIDAHNIDLWPKINELNFVYSEEAQEYLKLFPDLMKYNIISNKVNLYHKVIFMNRNSSLSIKKGKVIKEESDVNSYLFCHKSKDDKVKYIIKDKGESIPLKVRIEGENITTCIMNDSGYLSAVTGDFITMTIGYNRGNYKVICYTK